MVIFVLVFLLVFRSRARGEGEDELHGMRWYARARGGRRGREETTNICLHFFSKVPFC
jgi:hypothetical protein